MTSCELTAEQEEQYPQVFDRKPFQSIGVAPYIEVEGRTVDLSQAKILKNERPIEKNG
ncbi:hypothetical protein [Celeribacter sp.]|uniref:hypothetical protein n=1 Tax=Celeribacter sp. TaxID=1890673 RepID=UPI003A95BC9A